MDFTLNDEQTALRDAVRGLLTKAYGDFENRRQAAAQDPGFSEQVWGQLAEMGLLALPFAEADGGVGAGPIEVGLVCRELGRVNAPEPYLASVAIAGGLIAASPAGPARTAALEALAGGESVLAYAESADGKTAEPVWHGGRADAVVVNSGGKLWLLASDKLSATSWKAYDGSRAARLEFDLANADELGSAEVVAPVLDVARILVANQALGAMQTQLQITTGYLKSRKQFGVPLSMFQALVFRAADMYVSLELTDSLVSWATMKADLFAKGEIDAAELADAAARAALQASRASRHIGQEAIQLHGGIAMTAEYSVGNTTAHLTLLDHLLGDGDSQLQRLGARVGDYAMVDPIG